MAAPNWPRRILISRGFFCAAESPHFLVVNKIDTEQMEAAAENFRQLGFKNVQAVSSEHGIGIGDLLEDVFAALPPEVERPEESPLEVEADATAETDEDGENIHRSHGEFEQHETKVAIIGRPNVGKSTLLNALTGTSRAIVSPIAGTTRDAVDELMEYQGPIPLRRYGGHPPQGQDHGDGGKALRRHGAASS